MAFYPKYREREEVYSMRIAKGQILVDQLKEDLLSGYYFYRKGTSLSR
jgi:hypothetical protein